MALSLNLFATLEAINNKMFPNIYVVLKIVTIIPVTTVTVEWSNSALKYVTTALCITLGQERLNYLLLFIYKDIPRDYNVSIIYLRLSIPEE